MTIGDTSVQRSHTDGSFETVTSITRDGETTAFVIDDRNRVVETQRQADSGTTLASGTGYDAAARVRFTEDPYGRRSYHVYNQLDHQIRTVEETVPGAITLPADDLAIDPVTGSCGSCGVWPASRCYLGVRAPDPVGILWGSCGVWPASRCYLGVRAPKSFLRGRPSALPSPPSPP